MQINISVLYFRIQDVCIIFAVIVVFLLFFNTYIFQAGLVNILINKFKIGIMVTFLYFGLNVGLHVWEMVSLIKNTNHSHFENRINSVFVTIVTLISNILLT